MQGEIVNKIKELCDELDTSFIYVASSIAALSDFPDPARLGLSAIYSAMESDTTIIMPSGSNSFRANGVFDRESTPSTSGILTEIFRAEPAVLRSYAPPFNAVCAKGPVANKISLIESETQFGPESIYDYLVDVNATVLLFGCSFNNGVAHMHWLEERHGCCYREWKRHQGLIVLDGRSFEREFSHYTRNRDFKISYQPLEIELDSAGVIRRGSVGLLSLSAFSLADFVSVLDPWFPRYYERLIVR